MPVRTATDEALIEIEALLTAFQPARRRRVRSWVSRRAGALLAVVIATSGLALASLGVLSRVCDGGRCEMQIANATAPASPKLAMASEPRADATIAEGRSVGRPQAANETAAKDPVEDGAGAGKASPARVASIAPTADATAPVRRGGHLKRHHDRRAGPVYRQAWR